MSEFTFHIDQKETVWRRNFLKIEAYTEEEAIQKIKSMSDFECDSVVYDNELILETCEDMNYDENSNQPTREIFYNGRMIADNTPIEVKRDKIIDSLIR